jgi:hypothetical protein
MRAGAEIVFVIAAVQRSFAATSSRRQTRRSFDRHPCLYYAPSQLKIDIAGKPASNPSAYDDLVAFATPVIIKKFS